MYPKNNASPPRLAVGQVVQISDGAVQSSGVTITVRGEGAAEATGGGTTAYGAEGTVYYTPTQAETNYTAFVLIASKASCYSASITVVTTATATAGTVDVGAVSGDTTAADNMELMFDGTGYAGGTTKLGTDVVSISGDTTAADNMELDYDGTGYAKANSTIGTCTSNTDMRGTDSAALASVCTEARLGELDGANLPQTCDNILTDTAEIGAAGIGLSNIPWNAAWDAEVESECTDALVAMFTSSAQLVDDIWDEDLSPAHDTAGSSGKALQDAGSAGDPWSTAVPGAYGAGTAGFILGTNLDAASSTLATSVALATAQLDLDTITGADGVNLLSATQASIDAIETDTSTTLQAELDAIQAAVITNAAGVDIAADIIAMKAETALIVADTNELQTDWANGGRLDLLLDSVLALLDDARTEPGQGAPPVNPDAMTKIDYLYKAWRNKKTQTATTASVFADDGTTVDHKATVSDDGTTATIGELVTGP